MPADCRKRPASRGVIVGICESFVRIKEICDSGELHFFISINHIYGRGGLLWTHDPLLRAGALAPPESASDADLEKCCDIDFLLWMHRRDAGKYRRSGSLRWYRRENARRFRNAACVSVEPTCPTRPTSTAPARLDLELRHTPRDQQLDEVIERHVDDGYGRCVFRCDNSNGGQPGRLDGDGKRRHGIAFDGDLYA